ncbi:MAG: mechanosensitive ion channel, partial [Planctomycetes bacterium]|nr:mechanosensitive ion channel [Planctomycetota bacterium]
MLEGLDTVSPDILDLARAAVWAVVLLLFATLVTIPIRRLFGHGHSDQMYKQKRSARRFFGMLLCYPAFSVAILLPSLVLFLGLNDDAESVSKYYQAWLLFWVIYGVVRLIEGVFAETFVQMGKRCPVTRFNRGLVRLAIMLGVAFLLIRYQLEFNISFLLTSTAIVTGVLGFAMQGVLGNLMAGVSLHGSRSMTVGDWVEVEGIEAQVILVNWRDTRLRTLGGHIIIVPNGKLGEQMIRNFSSPTRLRRHEIPVAASYGDVPGDVIAALLEAANDIETVEKRPAPDAYVTGFKDFCIEYVLRFWSTQYEQHVAIDGQVMQMIWYKFTRRGIEIPFPMSGRLLGNFMEAVHAQKFEMPLARDIEAVLDDLMQSDFGHTLMADEEGRCLLNREELRDVARHVKRTLFTRGECLMHQNDTGELFYVLVQGTIHGAIAHTDEAKPVEFDLSSGALFGEMSLLTGSPRSATMTATAESIAPVFVPCESDSWKNPFPMYKAL